MRHEICVLRSAYCDTVDCISSLQDYKTIAARSIDLFIIKDIDNDAGDYK